MGAVVWRGAPFVVLGDMSVLDLADMDEDVCPFVCSVSESKATVVLEGNEFFMSVGVTLTDEEVRDDIFACVVISDEETVFRAVGSRLVCVSN